MRAISAGFGFLTVALDTTSLNILCLPITGHSISELDIAALIFSNLLAQNQHFQSPYVRQRRQGTCIIIPLPGVREIHRGPNDLFAARVNARWQVCLKVGAVRFKCEYQQ